ncbi:MAG: hypothetical protein E7632_12670 [Ruminococcaceae bacterium]|nr:hypothetical protein [Oscillospiraceae bacterium]
MNEQKTFQYTYSAVQNQEIQSIRQKYLPGTESKLDRLKRLDHTVNRAGMTVSLILGVLGCLVFGTGMCFAMKVIGDALLPGILLGLIGAMTMGAAYPAYRALRRKKKAELIPQILALTDELMKG